MKHPGVDTFKKPMMCHKIAANNALSVLIDRTNQDTDNSLKDNSISTTISQDTELLLYNAGYHKTNEKLKRFVSHQKYNHFKKSLQNLGEDSNSLNEDENAYSFGMHSIDALNEDDNQTHYQSQHDCKKWDKYQHLKVIHLLAEIAWDASLSYFDRNKNNAWCMNIIFWSFIVHQELIH